MTLSYAQTYSSSPKRDEVAAGNTTRGKHGGGGYASQRYCTRYRDRRDNRDLTGPPFPGFIDSKWGLSSGTAA